MCSSKPSTGRNAVVVVVVVGELNLPREVEKRIKALSETENNGVLFKE